MTQSTKAARRPFHKNRMDAKRDFIRNNPKYSMRACVTFKYFEPIVNPTSGMIEYKMKRLASGKPPFVHAIPVEAISGRGFYIPAGDNCNLGTRFA